MAKQQSLCWQETKPEEEYHKHSGKINGRRSACRHVSILQNLCCLIGCGCTRLVSSTLPHTPIVVVRSLGLP